MEENPEDRPKIPEDSLEIEGIEECPLLVPADIAETAVQVASNVAFESDIADFRAGGIRIVLLVFFKK